MGNVFPVIMRNYFPVITISYPDGKRIKFSGAFSFEQMRSLL